MIKLLRRRRRGAGVTAAKLSIRREWPLPWRIAAVVILSAVALALAGLFYDAGRQFAGFHKEESQAAVADLQAAATRLQQDLDAAQKIADSSVSRLQMEVTAQERLAALVKNLETENARMKADLAVFESLAGNDPAKQSVVISRIDVRQEDDSGRYRYRMLVAKSSGDGLREFSGRLELLINVRRGQETAIIKWPTGNDAAAGAVTFKSFKRLEGSFQIARSDVMGSVEARLIEGGRVRASQLFKP